MIPDSIFDDKRKYYSHLHINNFYKKIKFSKFMSLTEERAKEIDELVNIWWNYFHNNTLGFLNLMSFLAMKLTASSKKIGLFSGDEILYFYVKMIDPSLVFLEIYESSSTKEELVNTTKLNFKIYDNVLIYLENCLNKRFKFYNPDDLWARDSIRR